MAIQRDLIIEQGEEVLLSYTWRTKSTNEPVDLTGCTMYLQARATPNPTSPLLIDASTDNGRIVVSDPTEGKFYINLTDEYIRTLNLPAEPVAKRATYELVCYFGGGVRKLMKGQVLFYKTVVYPA